MGIYEKLKVLRYLFLFFFALRANIAVGNPSVCKGFSVQISATISQDLKDKMDAEKAKTGETTAELISRLIEAI